MERKEVKVEGGQGERRVGLGETSAAVIAYCVEALSRPAVGSMEGSGGFWLGKEFLSQVVLSPEVLNAGQGFSRCHKDFSVL